MSLLKVICGLLCLLTLASNVRSMSRWSEARGVYDDVCYLRQAHLFQQFGPGGFDTDISRDDDRYLASKLKEIGFPTWSDLTTAPCHTSIPTTGKRVLQYPPGTGMALAAFPEGHQVVPLYVTASLIVFGFALFGIFRARGVSEVLFAGTFGCLAVYLMINPSKASYSMAPTMATVAAIGYLTALLFAGASRHRHLVIALLGLLLGLSVNFRLPNLLLSAGYFLSFGIAFLSSRKIRIALDGALFSVAFMIGMAPTLLANAINAGSPFATTYGGQDVAAPDLSFKIVWQYAADPQFALLGLAGASIAFLLGTRGDPGTRSDPGIRRVALLTAINLVVNLAFFLSHPVFTPYYTVPVAMLSLWSLVFAPLVRPAEAVDGDCAGQAVTVRS